MLEILISSSVLILVLAVLRLVLREKVSARLQYALWLLVLVRLLIPVSFFHSPVSVTEAVSPITDSARGYSLQTGALPTDALNESVTLNLHRLGVHPEWEEYVSDGAGGSRLRQFYSVRQLGHLVWVAGSLGMAAWFLLVNIRLARRLRRDRRPYGIHTALPVYVTEGVPSPCLFGLLRPAIYLTERAAEDEAQARQIAAHELTHFHHGDIIWSLLRSVCLAVWWFNPLVWLAAALSRQDCELACDEGTIKALGEEARFDYGRTLVGMAKVGTRPSDLLCGATTMTTGKKSLKERVSRIAKAPKMSVTVAVIVLVIAAVAVGCTFSGAAERAPVEPGIAVEITQENASASDADDLGPKWMELYYAHEAVTTSHEAEEVQAFFDVYRSVRALAAPPGDDFAGISGDPIFSINLYPAAVGYMDYPVIYSLMLLEDDWFVLPDEADPVNGQALVWQDKNGLYSGLLEDLIDEFHSESVAAEFVSGEPIGSYDRAYWEEVDRELASFAYPTDLEWYVSDDFDTALPEDDIFGPLTLEDYIYGTDAWQFQYNGEPVANEPMAFIYVHDADGRTLRIMDDVDMLMIGEADGSITWATMPDGVDCADMIRRLLPWTRGEYVDPILAAQEEEAAQTRAVLDQVGDYGLPGWTQLNAKASIGTAPYDDERGTELYHALVYKAYVAQDGVTDMDLHYERFWSDDPGAGNITAETFDGLREFYPTAYEVFSDGFTVGGQPAFAMNMEGQQSLWWYDAQRDMIFYLWTISAASGEIDEPLLGDMLALAESVTAQ